ncbi:MAG: DUF5011 domain-containing protein [Parcubacteria group bacterium]|nr:DUF5011 domain-containing protein [Parcubacteria group bacterium]
MISKINLIPRRENKLSNGVNKTKKIIKTISTAILIFSFIAAGLNLQVSPAKAALMPGGATGPVSPETGLPNWYMDQNGLVLELIESADGFGIGAPVDPDNSYSVATGLGDETFYWSTEADVAANGMNILAVLAMEANSTSLGDAAVFGRVRFKINVPEPGTYTVRYPFGVNTYEVAEIEPGPEIFDTSDIGCIGSPDPITGLSSCNPIISPNPAGNFSAALNSLIGPFLTWDTFNLDPALTDPALINPAFPGKRYVGNPAVAHLIKGSPVNQNFLEITGPGGIVARTDLFAVSGRLAVIDTVAPVVASVSPTEIIVDALGNVAPNTVVSANITDDLGVRAATIDLSALSNDFSATLNGAQEVPGAASGATGSGSFIIDTAANTLSFNLNYSGLVGGAETAAHIHGPAAAGINALPVFTLPLGASKMGVWNYPENLEADILAGNMYVNIHTTLFPNGEIRGQILRTPNIQNMIRNAGTITDGTWSIIIPGLPGLGTFNLPILTHDGANIANFNFQLSVVNPAPTANPDTANIGIGVGEFADIEVMLNDIDSNGNLPLSLVSAQNVSAGTAVIAADRQHIIVTAPTIDFEGVITAEYTIADSLGVTANGNITVNVTRDTTAPVIAILGDNPASVSFGATSYVDAGATALDDFDGNVTARIIATGLPVDTRGASPQTITYTVSDSVGNTAIATRIVNIVPDTIAPVITLNGVSPMAVEIASVFTDPGAIAVDDVDGAVAVSAVSAVNTAVLGTYAVNYTASDTSGNTSVLSRAVNVVPDATSPVITILGNNPATVLINAVYADAGATALDNVDGVVAVQATSTVNTAVIGNYTVTYTAIDAAGNISTTTRNVNVAVPAPAPEPTPAPANNGGGGGGFFLPPAQFQNTVIAAVYSPEVEKQINRQLEIEKQAKNQGQVLGEKIEFRQAQIREIENEAELVHAKDLSSLLLNIYAARQQAKETEVKIKFTAKLKANLKGLSQDDESAITNFITYGTANTKKLGQGERTGVLDSYKAAYGKLPTTKSEWQDALKIAVGRFPGQVSAQAETRAKVEFKKIYLREANLNNEKDKAAVNVMAYGLRPDKRNTNSEKAAINSFKAIFKKAPTLATDWDKVRAIAYSGAKK